MALTLPQLLSSEQAHPVALLRAMIQKYSLEWMSWGLRAVRQTLEHDFPSTEIAEISLHKLLAAAAVAVQPNFWEEWEHFHFLAQALSNNIPDPANHKNLTVSQMMAAVDMAKFIRKDLGELSPEPEFSEEVAKYVASQALADGIWYLPDPLGFAANHASGKSYRCKDCGNESEVLFNDGYCDSCTDRFDTDSLKDWKPDPRLIKNGRGRNLVYFEKNPTKKVAQRLFAVAGNPNKTLQETQTDICVAKLLVALQFVGYRRKQLEEQTA